MDQDKNLRDLTFFGLLPTILMTLLPYLCHMKKYRPTHRIFFMMGVGLMLTFLMGCNGDKTYSIKSATIEVDSLSQVIPITEPLVNPVLYTHVSGLSQLSPAEAKVKFVEIVLPAILVAKFEMEKLQTRIDKLRKKNRWKETDSIFYLETKNRFKAKDLEDLSSRIGTLPTSIVLAQAAVESGWGQSRFFLEGNNLFGVWSYNADEPRIAAGLNRQEKQSIFVPMPICPNLLYTILKYWALPMHTAACEKPAKRK